MNLCRPLQRSWSWQWREHPAPPPPQLVCPIFDFRVLCHLYMSLLVPHPDGLLFHRRVTHRSISLVAIYTPACGRLWKQRDDWVSNPQPKDVKPRHRHASTKFDFRPAKYAGYFNVAVSIPFYMFLTFHDIAGVYCGHEAARQPESR